MLYERSYSLLLSQSALKQLLWEILRDFVSTWNKLVKHGIYPEILLMEVYAQVAVRKELFIAPFAERFKTTTLGKFC